MQVCVGMCEHKQNKYMKYFLPRITKDLKWSTKTTIKGNREDAINGGSMSINVAAEFLGWPWVWGLYSG